MYRLWSTAADRLGTLGDGPRTYRPVLTLKHLVALGATLMIMQALMFTTSHADVWIAGMCFRSDSVALYAVGRRLVAVVAMLPQIAGVAISAPIATLNAQGRLAEMQQFVRTSATLTAVPSVIACLALIIAGGPILEVLFGPFYRQAAGALAVLAIGQAAVAWCGLSGYVLTMTGHQNVVVFANLITAVALLAIGPWAGARFGMLGVSWTSSALLIFHTVLMWVLAGRLVGVWTHGTLAILRWPLPRLAKEGQR
jgi:O-antigen/teichoic acid export membrane protein